MNNHHGICETTLTSVEVEGVSYSNLDVTFYYEEADQGVIGGPADRWEAPTPEYYEIHQVTSEEGEPVYLSAEGEEELIEMLQREVKV